MEEDKKSSPAKRRSQYARWILLAVVGVAGVFVIMGYQTVKNDLVSLEQQARTQWQQVNVQLVRQYELIPKLVDTTRAYADHERDILEELVAARDEYLSTSADRQPELAGELESTLTRFLAVAESYPELRADQLYRDLSYELSGTKNRIAVERMRYNAVVGEYNTSIRQCPGRWVALGQPDLEYFEAPEQQLAEPEWSLD
jgi:LemA protein